VFRVSKKNPEQTRNNRNPPSQSVPGFQEKGMKGAAPHSKALKDPTNRVLFRVLEKNPEHLLGHRKSKKKTLFRLFRVFQKLGGGNQQGEEDFCNIRRN
jgi:hypothetical protein